MLLNPDDLARRRCDLETAPELRSLAERLRRFVSPLLVHDLYFPEQKALLSREGGICADDGSRLTFDPWEPVTHRCPACARMYEGERHHRAWIWRYHIWLSERAIHLALLGCLLGERKLVERAQEIVRGYSDRYRAYPNSDNVLGPTRLFFSTYLESIWLIQLVVAASFTRRAEEDGWTEATNWVGFDRVVEESAGLIESFDEGGSNRQVWNNAAMVAAGIWLGRGLGDPLFLRGLRGQHGILAQLTNCVTDGGLWFEGENYHFFALRGFLLAAELLRGVGVDLYGSDAPAGRLADMYRAPLLTALPDLTLPARGDSPFGVSLLQPRFAELWEVGWVRTRDRQVESILTHLYSADAPDGADPGESELAEQEQNRPAQRLGRRLLGWKALWCMETGPPEAPADIWQSGSRLLSDAGVAVMRPTAGRYVSVECGGAPGGHGHPDLLHLTLFWERPYLLDFGTGSYVSPSLHWYRSTLAHNAPGVSGIGQLGRSAWCAAFDRHEQWQWCRVAAADLLGEGSKASRTLVVGPDYVLDRVEIDVSPDREIDLPLHCIPQGGITLADLPDRDGAAPQLDAVLGNVLVLHGDTDVRTVSAAAGVLLEPRPREQLLITEAPGPPTMWMADGSPLAFLVRRANGSGVWTQCWSFESDSPTNLVTNGSETLVEFADGSHDRIAFEDRRCSVTDRAGKRHRLTGAQPTPPPISRPKVRHSVLRCPLLKHLPPVTDWESEVPRQATVELGAAHYRRSEYECGARGNFSAKVAVFACGDLLCFAVNVVKSELCVRRAEDPDPNLDNEVPDIHSDGVQVYADIDGWSGFLVVPDPDSDGVRVAGIQPTVSEPAAAAGGWARTERGYRLLVHVSTGRSLRKGDRILVNLIVNEMYSSRQRRAGQLALSGGGGWVYLRGDREHPAHAVIAEVM